MKNLMSLLVIIGGLSMVACSDDKNNQQAQAQACAANQECLKKAAAMAQVPGTGLFALSSQYAGVLPPNAVGGIPVGTNPGLGQVKAVSGAGGTVDQKSLSKMAAKVKADLDADSLNPRSLHYDPPQADGGGRAPASVSTSSVADQASAPPVNQMVDVGGGNGATGEIAR